MLIETSTLIQRPLPRNDFQRRDYRYSRSALLDSGINDSWGWIILYYYFMFSSTPHSWDDPKYLQTSPNVCAWRGQVEILLG